MGRPKGSKNKDKSQKKNGLAELDAEILRLQGDIRKSEEAITAINLAMEAQKNDLKAVKASLRKTVARCERLQEKKEALTLSMAEHEKMKEASTLLNTLLANGKTTDDILTLLQK